MGADALSAAKSGESGRCVVLWVVFFVRVLVVEAIVVIVRVWRRDVEESICGGKGTGVRCGAGHG